VLPDIAFGVDEPGKWVVEVVGDGDRDEAGRVAVWFPGGKCVAEFGGAAVVDLGGADGAQPHVAAGLQPAIVGAAVLDPDLYLIADRDGAAVALPQWCVRVGGRRSLYQLGKSQTRSTCNQFSAVDCWSPPRLTGSGT
jgi:hypothetical protein